MNKTFGNHVAVFIWLFTAAYSSAVAAMIYLLIRDGLPEGDSLTKVVLVVSAFVAGVGVLVWLSMSRPCVTVRPLGGGRIKVGLYYPHRWLVREMPLSEAQPAVTVETEDSEGDPYFYTQISAGYPFSVPVKIAEGSRAHCEATRDRFNALS